MANLPYLTAPGNVSKAFNAIIVVATPQKVTQDFVKEMLKIPGSSGNQISRFLKKLGMANQDGTPTDTYKRFRNENTRGAAEAAALRHAYAPLFQRNEYTHTLSEAKLKGLIIEETGADANSSTVRCTLKCIQAINSFAKHEAVAEETKKSEQENLNPTAVDELGVEPSNLRTEENRGVGMNLSYTINLNLPATSDIAVFNAIFKSLKENLLRTSDG